jgi:hypothetical protein
MTEVTSVKGHALTNILRKSVSKVHKYARKARGCPKYVVEQSYHEYVVELSIDISAGRETHQSIYQTRIFRNTICMEKTQYSFCMIAGH